MTNAFREIVKQSDTVTGWFTIDDMRTLYGALVATQLIPGDLVEIGSYLGRSAIFSALVLQRHNIPKKIYSIDPHLGQLGLPGQDKAPTWDRFLANVAANGCNDWITPIRMKAEEYPWDKPIALLHIDGLHHLDHVLGDFYKYSPYVSNKGFVAFHDWGVHGEFYDVTQALAKILLERQYKIFIASRHMSSQISVSNEIYESDSSSVMVLQKL